MVIRYTEKEKLIKKQATVSPADWEMKSGNRI